MNRYLTVYFGHVVNELMREAREVKTEEDEGRTREAVDGRRVFSEEEVEELRSQAEKEIAAVLEKLRSSHIHAGESGGREIRVSMKMLELEIARLKIVESMIREVRQDMEAILRRALAREVEK